MSSTSIYKKSNEYDREYSTILVRARSRNTTFDKDDLPVDLVVSSNNTETRTKYRTDREKMKSYKDSSMPKAATAEYYSDKNFSSYFLDSNPKLDQMLQKIEK